MELIGRQAEAQELDRLLADALAGQSRVAVIRGEAGVGKTSLLQYLCSRAEGWQVAAAAGTESEMDLAYSGLHQVCRPILDHVDRLPLPQRHALEVVFGRSTGPAPDRFLVGLATLTLLADAAEEQPVLCVVDDAQWLDRASAQILAFVGRRILAERIAIVLVARSGGADDVLVGLPELLVHGLDESHARALLLQNVRGPLDAAVCNQIVAESHGNPLALIELPRTWNEAELAGGFGLPDEQAVAGKIEQSYARRLVLLPAKTQLFVLAAAAEPLGDPVLLQRAAATLDLAMETAFAATEEGLLSVGARIEFAHPLVRSAAYHSASADDRHRVHRALAEAIDAERDPDRRAWHLARATRGPTEEVAAELERSASRAQARSGLPAAAAFLQRSVALTEDPARRSQRALSAAHANLEAGAFDSALGLLATAETGPLDDLQRAHVDLVRAQIAFASGLGSDAPPLLLAAAGRLEPYDVDLARETYLDAWGAALFAGRFATSGNLLEVSRTAKAALAAARPLRPSDLLLDGLATLVTDGRETAVPLLRRAADAFAHEGSAEESFRWGWLTTIPSNVLWDEETWQVINERQLRRAREVGALVRLPIDLTAQAVLVTWQGDFPSADSAIAEIGAVTEATGTHMAPFAAMLLSAFRGREDEATSLIGTTIAGATAGGQGIGAQFAEWIAAVLWNGLARYEDALAAARNATDGELDLFLAPWALPELVEAAVKTRAPELGERALERLARTTTAAGTDWALGIEARCRALLADGDDADQLYSEAIARLSRTRLRPELARTHLLYGEWLRREGRRIDARAQLRAAADMLAAIGMDAYAERARRELLATGERARRRSPETRGQLTPQELQIATLARDGLSNPEIGAQLFLSARTVEWHLRKVFLKLGISSRRQLRASLAAHEKVVVVA